MSSEGVSGGAKALLPSGSAIKLFRKIKHQADKNDGSLADKGIPVGYAWAKYQTYAKWMLCDVRHIFRLIRELLDFGWIEKQVRPGVQAFLRPLINLIPSPSSHRPRPPEPWKEPVREIPVPDGQSEPTRYPVNPAPVAAAQASKSQPAMSGVLSGVRSRVYRYKSDKSGEQQGDTGAKGADNRTPEPVIAEEDRPVVAIMQKCGIQEASIPKYLATLGRDVLQKSCAYVLRRLELGRSGSAGYAVEFARRLKAGEWHFDAWYVKELEDARKAVEAAEHKKKPAVAIPADWLPGVPDDEARDCCYNAIEYLKVLRRGRVDPFSIPVRDEARKIWLRRHTDERAPWATEGREDDDSKSVAGEPWHLA